MANEAYFSELGEYQPMDREEVGRLAKEAQAGNIHSRNRLVTANLRLVLSFVSSYGNPAIMLDAVQEGNMGLMKAVDHFDPDNGASFGTYATFWIRAAVFRYFKANGLGSLRLPVNKLEAISRLKSVVADLYKRTNKQPSASEIADELNRIYEADKFSAEDIELLKELAETKVDSLDDSEDWRQALDGEDGRDMENVLGNRKLVQIVRSQIGELKLKPIEKALLEGCLFDDKDYRQVARELGISNAQAKLYFEKSMRILRHSLRIRGLVSEIKLR